MSKPLKLKKLKPLIPVDKSIKKIKLLLKLKSPEDILQAERERAFNKAREGDPMSALAIYQKALDNYCKKVGDFLDGTELTSGIFPKKSKKGTPNE